jgi:hypothetical protein
MMTVAPEHDVLRRPDERERAERRQSMTSILTVGRAVVHVANLSGLPIRGKKFRPSCNLATNSESSLSHL